MKRINFFTIFLLLPIIIFCFSSNTFAASYGGKEFPDFPEDLNDVVVIHYEPYHDLYVLHTSETVSYGGSSVYPKIIYRNQVKRYRWFPKTSNEWSSYGSDDDYYTDYRPGEDGKYYDGSGHEVILVYSNVNIVGEEGFDFFFPATLLPISMNMQSLFMEIISKMTNQVGGILGIALQIFGILLAVSLVVRYLRSFL